MASFDSVRPAVPVAHSDGPAHRRQIADAVNLLNTSTPDYRRTQAEIAAEITPANGQKPEGYAERYGNNETPGTTDFKTAIQNAVAVVDQRGGGIVYAPPSKCAVSGPIEITTKIILQGEGRETTELFLASGSNSAVIKTEDFDDQTGQNLWVISDGIHYGFGIRDIKINGNEDGQTDTDTPPALQWYGNGYLLENVIIEDTKGVAFYAEAGAKTSGGLDYRPVETKVNYLTIKRSGTDAVVNRGPHDGRWDQIYIAEAGFHSGSGRGWVVESLADTYSGTCDIGFMHVYSCRGVGVDLQQTVRAEFLISESNWDAGIKIGSLADGTQIGMAYLFNNNAGGSDPGDDPALDIAASECQIGILRIRDQNDGGGVVITGSKNSINDLWVDGLEGTQIGVDVDANATTIKAPRIQNYDGDGGIGLRTGNSGALIQLDIDAQIENCDTGWSHVNSSNRSHYRIRIHSTSAEQICFTGAGPGTHSPGGGGGTRARETWDVVASNTGTSHSGTAQAGGASTITFASTAGSRDDAYIGCIVTTTGGTGSGQSRVVSDYDGSTKVATVSEAWDTQPDSTTTYTCSALYLETKTEGTATVPSGSTSVTVAHGLLVTSMTPTARNVTIWPTNGLGDAAQFWVSDVDKFTFTITVDSDPGSGGATFAWRAALAE